jgi:hypothetical protein
VQALLTDPCAAAGAKDPATLATAFSLPIDGAVISARATAVLSLRLARPPAAWKPDAYAVSG